MLRIVVKSGETIKIGDEIVIKSMTDGRVSLAIDAPKKLKIERVEAEKPAPLRTESIVKVGANGSKKFIIVNERK